MTPKLSLQVEGWAAGPSTIRVHAFIEGHDKILKISRNKFHNWLMANQKLNVAPLSSEGVQVECPRIVDYFNEEEGIPPSWVAFDLDKYIRTYHLQIIHL